MFASRSTFSSDDAAAVTPSDSVNLARTTRGIYTGSGGDISVMTAGRTIVLFAGTAAGSVLPIQAIRVRATGTVATSIVALF